MKPRSTLVAAIVALKNAQQVILMERREQYECLQHDQMNEAERIAVSRLDRADVKINSALKDIHRVINSRIKQEKTK
jgi:G3E family GTPase